MIAFLFLLGLALGAVPPSARQEVDLPCGNYLVPWYKFNSRVYKYVSTRMTWADAEHHCVSEGAHLVSIHYMEEHTFVKSLIKNFDMAEGFTWIGFSDLHNEGHWTWSDGSAVNFVFWNEKQPDNWRGEHCGHMNYDSKWNDILCSNKYSFVCALG